MKMKKFKRLTALCLVLCLCVCLFGCKQEPTNTTGPEGTTLNTTTAVGDGQPQKHTVKLVSNAGTAFAGVGIYVYEDDTKQELVWFAKTDDGGSISFNAVPAPGMVAILDGVPDGYALQESYPIASVETQIVLEAEIAGSDGYIGKQFGLGDVMWDLTVTDMNGQTQQLSQLLEQKKAVMLNFWYLDCAPCRMEFPYLQQAFESHQDKIALVALNSIDGDAAAVAEYAQTNGLTFPIAQCAPEMSQALGISGFPTTIVIDRYGIISLVHTGGIDGAGAFGDVMDFFTGDDYTQTLVRDINTIITPEDNNDEPPINNPTSVSGVSKFQLTVRPGETVYVDLYRVNEMYLQINSQTCELDYNGKTFKPSNGRVGTMLSCKDVRTPTTIGLRNTGTETTTYDLHLSVLAGSLNNPYTMKLEDFDVDIPSGKQEGLYYRWKAEADGYLTVQCLSATAGVPYGYTLYNLSSYANRNLESDGEKNADGNTVLRIAVRKGESVQFNPSALPNDSGSYPAIHLRFRASFSEGLAEDEKQEEKLLYAVSLVDGNRAPIAGVTVEVTTPTGVEKLTTNEKGAAAVELVTGEYIATVRLPEGYTARITQLKLTGDAPIQSIKLDKQIVAVTRTYTVKVTDETGAPLADVLVSLGDSFTSTDPSGVASFTLEEGSHMAIVDIPAGYYADSMTYEFPEGSTQITVVLQKQTQPPVTEPEETQPPVTQPGQTQPEQTQPPVTRPEETQPPVDDKTAQYTVTVTDYFGAPMQGVTVTFRKNGVVVGLKRADANGVATLRLNKAEYTASLAFGSGSYYYTPAEITLTEAAPSVTVQAIPKRGSDSTELYVGKAYFVNAGATYVEGMQADVVNYLIYKPTESGFFRITTTDPGAVLSYWGANASYLADQTAIVSQGNNTLLLEIRAEYVNEDTMYVLGITGSKDATLVIQRVGDIILTDEEKAEWIIYQAKEPAQEFDLVLQSGEKLEYLDLTSESIPYVKGSDGYYHLNSATGPILYVNLGTDGRYMPFHAMLGFEQAGGTNFQCTFYEGDKFIKKENYTECMQSFVRACVDSEGYGVYPLNDDLIYMIQNGGRDKGWYEPGNPSFLFEGVEDLNVDIAWMFLICYVTK